ncbi:MAG: hypothetical protein ACI9OJ_003638 [Myxococcota bacterium]|jgi:hypothetical protein
MPADWTFDPVAMTADVKAHMVDPVKAAQQLFEDFPYTTRLFTTISPDEMTKDPLFSFNPDLADVSNVHTITASAQCKAGNSNVAEKVTFTFEDGSQQVLDGEFNSCGNATISGGTGGADGMDGADSWSEIQVLNESGPPDVVPAADVLAREARLDVRVPSQGQAGVEQNTGGNSATEGGETSGTTTARGSHRQRD